MKGSMIAGIGTFILCTTAQFTDVNPSVFIVLAFMLGVITSDMR